MLYPKAFENLSSDFKLFPGIGDKTAERFVYTVDSMKKENIEKFAKDLLEFKDKIKKCSNCGILTDKDICDFCSSEFREKNTICVVENSKDAFVFEKAGNFKGMYHVLGGLIDPINDVNPENINLFSLINERLSGDDIKEIILALSPSIEGETTSLYIQKLLENKKVKVSRLSYGIPMGSDIEYLDPIMISRALEDRKFIE